MSTTTPYKTRSAGFLLNTESTIAPSTLDASQNTALKNRVVTVGSDTYFVDATGKAAKLGGSESVSASPTGQAISIGTQAALDALTEKVTGGYYIVTDGPNQGDILVWADTTGDGVGDTWQVFQVPANGLEWTVLTNVTGLPAGQYTYTLATDTWAKTADVEPLIPPVDDPIAVGGIKFPTQKSSNQVNNGPMFIMYDSVTGFGMTASTATDDGTLGAVASGARAESVRKATYTQYQQNTPFTQLINYRPFFTDVHQNSAGAVALDHKGVVYFKGNATFMTAFANAESGLSNVAAPSYTPDLFWVNRSVKAVKIYLSTTNTVMVLAGDGTIWVKGDGAVNGIYGDGTVAANTLWHKVSVPQKAYKKIKLQSNTHAFALGEDGLVSLWGRNATNRFLSGANTGVYSSPWTGSVAAGSTVIDYDTDSNSSVAIAATGVRWCIGTNSNGKFGDGTTTTRTTWANAPSNGFTFAKVIPNSLATNAQDQGYAYITTDSKAVYTGYQNLNRGIAGKTAADNITTPTLMGNGAYQGLVVDVRTFTNVSLIQTNQGDVWTAVNGTGANYGEAGWGINTPSGNNIGLNTFKKVPIPAPVVSIYSNQNGSTEFATGHAVLTTEGRVYSWSGWYTDLQNSINYKRAPYEVPTNQFRQGEPKALEQIDLMKVVGTITAATPLTITDIIDGGSNQTVTATFNATGTAGTINLTGSTITGPDVTFVSWTTTSTFMPSTNANITVQFVVNATDIAALVPPNSQPQNWTLNLVVNGV